MTKWTEERRKKQAEAIRRHKPWEKSTGPKSAAGKQSSSLNSLKHGARSRAARAIRNMHRANQEFLKYCELYYAEDALEMRKTSELIKSRLKSRAAIENEEKK